MNNAPEPNPAGAGRGGRRRGLATRLLLSFLAVSLVPLLVASVIISRDTSQALEEMVKSKLAETAETRAAQIEAFFSDSLTDLVIEASRRHAREMLNDLRLSFEASALALAEFVKRDEWRLLAENYGKECESFKSSYGYHDFFIIDHEGNILYTVMKEPDLGTNIFTGKYARTQFGEACRKAFEEDEPTFSDFEKFEPSGGVPAGFIVTVIHDEDGGKAGLLALQISQERIDEIMQAKTGLGETGESYLIGTDLRMRSNSPLEPEQTVLGKRVETVQTRAWLKTHGAPGSPLAYRKEAPFGYLGYRAVPVIGTHRTIEIAGVRLGVIAEIEEAEAFAAIRPLLVTIASIAAVALAAVVVVAVALSRGITGPIMVVVRRLTATGSEMLAASRQQATTAAEQSTSVQETMGTMEELTETGRQVSEKARQVSTAAGAASTAVETGVQAAKGTTASMDAIREQVEAVAENIVALGERTQAVGEIIATVNELAEQSNLLALNASIEAASAGEEGSRFSVVANEMKNLADQSKEATVQIRTILQDLRKDINRAVLMTEEAVERVGAGKQQSDVTESTIREMAVTAQESIQTFQQIVASTGQQQIGFDQVVKAVQTIREGAEQMTTSTKQLEDASRDLNELAQGLRGLVEK